MLTNQTRGSLVQLLLSIAPSSVRVLLVKHLNVDIWPIDAHSLLDVTADTAPEEMTGLLVEVVGGATSVRADAPTKNVFDGRLDDLTRRLHTDGFQVIEEALVRLLPAAEPVALIHDELEATLKSSDLDDDGQIRRLLRDSREGIAGDSPDYNGATTKARISLETTARRMAAQLAAARRIAPPTETWGAALLFLRQQGVLTHPEEEALAKIYTLVSPGAHVPQGLTAKQWALLARAFTTSGTYFLLRRYLAT